MSQLSSLSAFLQDYGNRHSHPLNAILHFIGVPMVLYALYCMLTGSFVLGLVLFIFGYLLQYLGHRAQGNEVGEVILLKKIAAKFGYGYGRR